MLSDIKQDAESRMTKSVEALRSELVKLRTGRAHPSLLDQIEVSYYGTPTPLNQVAGVSVLDARTLTVSPWEKNLLPAIEKAIMTSDLGLNPASVGDSIRVPLPPLTEERRRQLMKTVGSEAEKAKVSIRNIRRDVLASLKDLLKEKEISEDDERRQQVAVQNMTDKSIAKVDDIVSTKEKDLMDI